MNDPGLSGLGPKDRRRALRNRVNRQRFLDTHPLAPLSEQEIQRQATGDLAAQYDPLVRSINAHTRAGAANIAGVADALARSLTTQPQTQADIYDRARANLGALDQAVADRLGASANAMNAGLQAKLQQAGIPAEVGSQFAAAAGHTPGVDFARNSAELGALNLREAAALSNAAQQQGFARALGLQTLGQYRARKQQELADLNDKRLSAAGALIQGIRAREYQKGATNLGFQGDIYAQNAATGRTQMAADAAMARTNAQQTGANARNAASNLTREQIATLNRREARAEAIMKEKGRNSRARATAARRGIAIDETRSAASGYLTDKSGRVIRYRHGPGKGKPIKWYGRKKHPLGKGKNSQTPPWGGS